MDVDQVVTTRAGGPEVFEVRRTTLTRDPDKALVRVEAAGVGSADVEMMRGRFYAQPKFPFVGGYDVVGTVVEGPMVGQRVAAMPRIGGWASLVQLDVESLVPVPDEVDPAVAVALVTNGVTAWRMVNQVARVLPGQTVLVHGASGGVGMLLTQFAVRAGATVIGTASAGKLAAVRALGAAALDYAEPLHTRADVVFDHLGGRHLVESYRLLNPGGVLVSYGAEVVPGASGPPVLPFVLISLRIAGWELRRLVGLGRGRKVRLFNVKSDSAFAEDLATVLAADLHVPVVRYPLAKAAKAVQDLVARKVIGKPVLVVD